MNKLLIAMIAGTFAIASFAQDKPAAPGAASAAAPVTVQPVAPDDKVAQEAKQKEAEEARRAAAAERAAAEKQRIEELFKACVIRPVMTDDEIEACKKAYRA